MMKMMNSHCRVTMVKFTKCVFFVACPYLLISFILLLYKLMEYSTRTSTRHTVDHHVGLSVYRILKATKNDHATREFVVNNYISNDLKAFKEVVSKSHWTEISALEFLQREPRQENYDINMNESTREKTFGYEIRYENFEITEPKFLSDSERKQFLHLQENVECLGPRPKNKLTGIIQPIPNGIASQGLDCGWPSKLEDFYSTDQQTQTDMLIPLLIPDSAAFQHFLDGSMPKIVQAYNIIMAPNVKLLMFSPRDTIIYDMLKKLNISTNKLVFYKDTVGARLQINSCITPPLHPLLWRKSRSMLGGPERLPVSVDKSYVVLLTRVGSYNGGRHMLNFEDVKKFLMKRYSSRLVIFEGDYNLQKTIQIFGKSSILIGVHGGAMYNLNFASSDAHIVEFLPMIEYGVPNGRIAHTIIWHMAQLLGQTYWRIHQTTQTYDGDINIPIEKLQTVLNVIDSTLSRFSTNSN